MTESQPYQNAGQRAFQKITNYIKKLQLAAGRKQVKMSHLTGVAGIVILLSVAVFTISSSRQSYNVSADEDFRQLQQDNGDTPHSEAPYNKINFQTAPDLPKLLSIKKLGVKARVTRLSARENSEPKSPNNIHDVGWYENSAKPAEPGATVLIGHIRGVERAGVFVDLTRLVPGDEFQLELGDGSIKNYQVVKMQAYPRGQVDFSALSMPAIEGRSGLNLLTAVAAYESNAEVVQQLAVFAIDKEGTSANQIPATGTVQQAMPDQARTP